MSEIILRRVIRPNCLTVNHSILQSALLSTTLLSTTLLSTTLLSTVLLSMVPQNAQAGNMYIYKDDSGQVLLTNVNPSGNFNKFNKKVKVTYYPNASVSSANTSTDFTSSSTASSPTSYRAYGASRSANRNAYDAYIRASAMRHGVDPALIKAMMHTESAFNPNARSPVGAQGLMQLMPATARRFSVRNAWNPAENIEGAAKYIAWLNKRFNGRIDHVLAGYNAGEGNVDKYGGIPPFRETQNYVKKVMGRYNSLYKNESGIMGVSGANTNGSTAQVQRVSFSTNRNSYAQTAFDALR